MNLSAFKQLDNNRNKEKLKSLINQGNKTFKKRPKIELLNAQTNPFTTPVSDMSAAEKANADLLVHKYVAKANAQKQKCKELMDEAIVNLLRKPNYKTSTSVRHSLNIKDTVNPLAIYLNKSVGGNFKFFDEIEK